jgi:hypothetical protein
MKLIDWYEEPNPYKIKDPEFFNLIPPKREHFNYNKINYLLGNINICNIDKTNDLRTYYIKNNLDLTMKKKLELLKENYNNYWKLPEEFLFSLAREKLGLPTPYQIIKDKRKLWLDKKKKEEEEDKLEDKFQKVLKKKDLQEMKIINEKKILIF